MHARIEHLSSQKLIGKKTQMSFADNQTLALWQGFMPRRKEIKNTIGSALYSVEVYNDPSFFVHFDLNATFEKWAAVEVTDFNVIPEGMEALTIPSGLYAVFIYKGIASEGAKTYQEILGTWIPKSEFVLDNRPHFALMGEKYKNNDPDSEEEIWIPVIQRTSSLGLEKK